MKRTNFFFIFSCIFLLFFYAVPVQAVNWEGGARLLRRATISPAFRRWRNSVASQRHYVPKSTTSTRAHPNWKKPAAPQARPVAKRPSIPQGRSYSKKQNTPSTRSEAYKPAAPQARPETAEITTTPQVHSNRYQASGFKMNRATRTFNPRIAITRFIEGEHKQSAEPIHMRVLPVPVRLANSPVFPLESQPHEMYRGMALDLHGNELRTILKDGMPVETSHFPIWFGSYDGKPYSEETKALFATTDPLLASTYAQMNRFRKDGNLFLPVVFHIKRLGKDIDPGEERTVEIPHDIPPEWIYKVSVLLSVDGKLCWGELKLDGEDGFLFTPYPPLPKKKLRY